jgi:phenylalanine-4-hydroxylase
MELNEVTRRLPKHLLQFVVDQPYSDYTPVDQAVWRYVMRRNCKHLKKIAHASYLHGLEVTGVEIDRIPTMYGMNRILKEIGWAAVAVDGFIPPGAFMEFTQYNVLVIAADIRTIEHIEYTPAPDIIHESAGHAPILAVREFADYLRAIGEAGAKAFSSTKDLELYEAIRHLSIIKEDPATKPEEIAAAERDIEFIQQHMGEPSEMARIRNLHWWTVEYGLIGSPDNFKLYGAGLLSSIGEAISCLSSGVKKLPYSLEAMNCNYDITKPQPQLFVTPDFQHLMTVLELFKQQMAWKRGGLYGVELSIASQQTSTIVLSSGLQLTGTCSEVVSVNGAPAFVRMEAPAAMAEGSKQLHGYGKDRFKQGMAIPLGNLMGQAGPFETLSDDDLQALSLTVGKCARLGFESGVTVEGRVVELRRNKTGRLLFINFSDVEIHHADKLLWKAETYTMPVGSSVESVFAGPADVEAFEPTASVPREKMHKIIHDESTLRLQKLYGEVRTMRDMAIDVDRLEKIYRIVQREFRHDWLLSLEILELLERQALMIELQLEIRHYLDKKATSEPALEHLIRNGLELLSDGSIRISSPSR